MESQTVDAVIDGRKRENFSLQCLNKDLKLSEDDEASNRLIRKVKPEHVLLLDSRVPKQIISFDEQYLRRCLELIQISALKAASCNMTSDMGIFPHNLNSISSGNINDSNGIVVGCPSIAGTENVFLRSSGDSILGAITGSKSMVNILKSPLLQQLGALDTDVNSGRTSLVDFREQTDTNFLSSPSDSNIAKLRNDMVILKDHARGFGPVRKSLGSLSSTTTTTSSDQSSSWMPATVSQGMLHCTWNNGFPRYVFSVDDQKEIYIANLKVESPDSKNLEYVYSFHSRVGCRKEDKIHEKKPDLVGKMRVSTSFTFSDNAEIIETQFVLFGIGDDCAPEMQATNHTLKQNRTLSKKVVDVLKASRTKKHRKFSLENSSLDPCQDAPHTFEPVSRVILTEDPLPPNHELAAIIVKDHVHNTTSQTSIGGWGLKFLHKVGSRLTSLSAESKVESQYFLRNDGDCSTSMDILIPAGFHGGPRNRIGGPSSLVERWRSGGKCDCGGWDIGCALKILKTKPTAVLSQTDGRWDSKTFNLFVEGSKQDSPTMKMINVGDGLYYIPFQPTLSAMQSFSIAAAIIHTQTPTLRSKLYKVK